MEAPAEACQLRGVQMCVKEWEIKVGEINRTWASQAPFCFKNTNDNIQRCCKYNNISTLRGKITNYILRNKKYNSLRCAWDLPWGTVSTHSTVSLLICVSCKCATQSGSCHMIRSISLQMDGFCLPLIGSSVAAGGFIRFGTGVNVRVIQVGSWHPLSPVSWVLITVQLHGQIWYQPAPHSLHFPSYHKPPETCSVTWTFSILVLYTRIKLENHYQLNVCFKYAAGGLT